MGACTRQCDVQRDDALAAARAAAAAGAGVRRPCADPQSRDRRRQPGARRSVRRVAAGRANPGGAAGAAHAKPARGRCRPPRSSTGAMTTSLAADECLEEIQWPVWRERRTGSAFTEISRRHGDFAMVAAAAQVAVDDEGRCTRATFGVGGAAPTPVAFPALAQRLVGTRLDKATLRRRGARRRGGARAGQRHPCQRRLPAPPRRRAGDARAAIRLRQREGGAMSEALYPIAIEVNGVKRTGHVAGADLAGRLAARASAVSPARTSAASTASAAPAR